jgi:UDP-N-acetylmuramyl pentapeptide phosphotransferase/UDP-N-acetylglucosamine-1-phosphate transferase
MNEILSWAAAGCAGAVLSWGITGAFRRWALKKRLLDYPNERSSHTRPTARGGGIGIVLVILAWGLFRLGRSFQGPPAWPFDPWRVGLILAGGILIAAVSWLDDARRGLSPGVRLAVHAAAAGLVLLGAGGWSRIALPVAGTVSLGVFGFAAALVWILGLVNAYNFMDGIDGIAGAQAVAAAAGWFAVGRLAGNPALSTAAVVIGASAIGFLIHNRPPARIFMGDVGSASLGYVFAVLPILVARTLPDPLAERAPVAGLLMVAPFVVDATFTFSRRLARRERLALAHRSHLYQRLVITGLGHGTVTGLYLILGVVGSAVGLAFLFVPDRTLAGLSAAAVLLLVWGAPWIWASTREKRAPKPAGVAPEGPA